ncbi:MAG: thioredoxin family protein [Bacteroidales bacterium]|nr:thioredoxin family protein [Bacteroidales bacterium]
MNLLRKLILTVTALFALTMAFAQMAEPVKWKFSTEKISDKEYNLVMTATIEDKWHLYSQHFDAGGPMPLVISFTKSDKYKTVGQTTESPAPTSEYDDVFMVNVKYFTQKATFKQKIEVLTDASFSVKAELSGQACFEDGQCLPVNADANFKIDLPKKETVEPEKTSAEPATTEEKTTEVAEVEPGEETATDSAQAEVVEQKSDKGGTPRIISQNEFVEEQSEDSSMWAFFFLSLLFGILGILTPCVFPMIPMTISFFMQGDSSKFNSILKALIFGISITVLYTIIGVIVSLTNAGAGLTTVLSTHWIPNLIFFVLFVAFAASLFGLFEIILPTSLANKSDKQVDKGGIFASFFLALTTVIVSFSCTGPIVGALLVKAASGNVLEPTIGMLGFGLGFALPFTILAIAPNWLKKLPKSGGWMNSVKVVMGFCLLAFSLKYFSNIDQNYHLDIMSRELYIAIWIVISVLCGLYLLGKIRFKMDSEVKTVGFFRMILASAFFVFALYLFPGMFGANLSSVSGLLPPMTTQNFNLADNGGAASEGALCGTPKYSESMHTAYGVNAYFDYKQAFDCAKSQGKPVILYFTGHSCANCKKMQAEIWANKTIAEKFNNEFVMTALYVDEKSVEVPVEEQFTSSNDGKLKKTLGEVNADLQIVNFQCNTQPYYVVVSPEGQVLTKPMSYNTNAEEFITFLNEGLENYNKKCSKCN